MDLSNSVYFLEFLVKEGQLPLAMSLAKKKWSELAEDIDIDALQAKYKRIQTYIKQRILPQLEGGQSLTEIETTFLDLLATKSGSSTYQAPSLSEQAEKELLENLFEIEKFAQSKNLYAYTPVQLLVLLNQKPSKTFDYFESFRPGLGISLQVDFDEFVNEELTLKGEGYEELYWEKMSSIKTAFQIAWFEGNSTITERHFLLGVVLSPSNTIHALKGAHGFDKWEFLEFLIEV